MTTLQGQQISATYLNKNAATQNDIRQSHKCNIFMINSSEYYSSDTGSPFASTFQDTISAIIQIKRDNNLGSL